MLRFFLLGFLFFFGVKGAVSQRYVSVELPFHYSHNFLSVQEDYAQQLKTKGGSSVAGGLGVKVNVLSYMVLRTGIDLWGKKLQSEFVGYIKDSIGRQITVAVSEDGRFRYAGLYLSLLFERKHFFIGGGVKFSVLNSYKGKTNVTDYTGKVWFNDNNTARPELAKKINTQAYMELMLGLRFAIKKLHAIKPVVSFGIPFKSLYEDDLDVPPGSPDFFILSPWIRVGIITEFVLKTFQPKVKRLELPATQPAPDFQY